MLDSAVRNMLDLSTAHLTKTDAELMEGSCGYAYSDCPRTSHHTQGYIVFVGSGDPDDVFKASYAMVKNSFSQTFIDIYVRAAEMQPPIMLINFDEDAEVVSDLPTFDW